jgi:hypothetical protein
MFARARQWLRVIGLPGWAVVGGPASVLTIWLIEWLLRLFVIWMAKWKAPLLSEMEIYLPEVLPVHQFGVVSLAIVFGLHRGSGFHPVSDKSYGTWLAQTPWRPSMPLPFGPAHLVWQDLAVVLSLTLLAILPPNWGVRIAYIPVAFAVAFCAASAVLLLVIQIYWAVVALILLAGVGAILWANVWWCLLISIAMCGVACLGIIYSLRDFPYTEEKRAALGLVAFPTRPALDVALAVVPIRNVGRWHRLITSQSLTIALVAGVLFFFIAYHFRNEPNAAKGMLYVETLIVIFAVFSRVLIYVDGRRSPISPLGRLATRRLIIPGYDRVFVGPLIALVVGLLLPHAMIWLGTAAIAAVPISLTVFVALVVLLPPGIERWYYTGHYRIPAVRRIGKDFVQA